MDKNINISKDNQNLDKIKIEEHEITQKKVIYSYFKNQFYKDK